MRFKDKMTEDEPINLNNVQKLLVRVQKRLNESNRLFEQTEIDLSSIAKGKSRDGNSSDCTQNEQKLDYLGLQKKLTLLKMKE
jgi:hypothetical protein